MTEQCKREATFSHRDFYEKEWKALVRSKVQEKMLLTSKRATCAVNIMEGAPRPDLRLLNLFYSRLGALKRYRGNKTDVRTKLQLKIAMAEA